MYKLLLCIRYLRSRKIFLFSVAGIVVGIAVLIVVTSLFDGFSRELRERIRGVTSHVVIQRPSGGIGRYEEVIALVRKVPHVTAAAPHAEGLAYVDRRGAIQPRGIQVIGIDPAREVGEAGTPGVSELGRYREPGAGLPAPPRDGASHPGILVGAEVLNKPPGEPGETLTLATILPKPGADPSDFDYKTQKVTVVGRFLRY